jgi:ATP-dependent exoDNAse (exonuclease V) alpha subunit
MNNVEEVIRLSTEMANRTEDHKRRYVKKAITVCNNIYEELMEAKRKEWLDGGFTSINELGRIMLRIYENTLRDVVMKEDCQPIMSADRVYDKTARDVVIRDTRQALGVLSWATVL